MKFSQESSAYFFDPDDNTSREFDFDEEIEAGSVGEALLKAADGYLYYNLNFSKIEDVKSEGDCHVDSLEYDEEKGEGSYDVSTDAGSNVSVSVKRID